jgi:hypothetical protein
LSIERRIFARAPYLSSAALTLQISTNIFTLSASTYDLQLQVTLPDDLSITPLPAALPFFASGVGVLGLLGRLAGENLPRVWSRKWHVNCALPRRMEKRPFAVVGMVNPAAGRYTVGPSSASPHDPEPWRATE